MIDRNKLLEAFELESSSLRRRQVTKSAIYVIPDEVSNNPSVEVPDGSLGQTYNGNGVAERSTHVHVSDTHGAGEPITATGATTYANAVSHGNGRPTASTGTGRAVDASDTRYSKVTIRTDLPPKLKQERGRLATFAFKLRKEEHLSTRIRLRGAKIILETRKRNQMGNSQGRWELWKE